MNRSETDWTAAPIVRGWSAVDRYSPACYLGNGCTGRPTENRLAQRHPYNEGLAGVAQLVEQLPCKQQVNGSSPFASLLKH